MMGYVNYIWDYVTGECLAEKDANGTTYAAYTNAPDFMGLLLSQQRGGASRYFAYDGEQSTTELTNTAQGITDEYRFTAFGESVSSVGITPNDFRFGGGVQWRTDDALDVVWFDRQVYDARLGRYSSTGLGDIGGAVPILPASRLFLFARNAQKKKRMVLCNKTVFFVDDRALTACYRILRAGALYKYLGGSVPCASKLMRRFLKLDKSKGCPEECLRALRSSLYWKFRRFVLNDASLRAWIAGCTDADVHHPAPLSHYQWDGQINFIWPGPAKKSTDVVSEDLNFAFHSVDVSVRAVTGYSCKPDRTNVCCCRCHITGSMRIVVSDVYDFCSSYVPLAGYWLGRAAICAAILDADAAAGGIAKDWVQSFNIKCGFSGQIGKRIKLCGGPPLQGPPDSPYIV